jgi:integrase/recombinase XerD
MQSYIDTYKKKDKRNLQGALNRFIAFLVEENKAGLTFGKLDGFIISDFQDYLGHHSIGEGGSSYFARFKKMMKVGCLKNNITSNPALTVPTKQGKARRKDIMNKEEIEKLASTPCESGQVKRAFLFSCLTGLRWVDVSNLKWSHVNYQGKYLVKRQEKTEDDVHINLNSAAMSLLGQPGKPEDLVFKLPTANGANKTVKAWVKRAGIEKKITWHNARHSFGTNLIFHGADVTTASSLLGHSTLKHTQRYVKAANELKQRATDSININL